MATNTLHIRVRSDGTRVVAKDIKSVGEAANVASRQIFLMRRAITTLVAAIGVRAGFRLIEEFTELNNKIKTVTSSTRELIDVRKKLLAISNDSRSSMGSIVQLYTRTTRAVKSLGLSEADRLKFTSLLAKESVIGGATTIEADNAIRQLTQGMGAAGLKGEELRSVLEQLPTVAQRIADFLGVAQGELRKLGEEGKLTGEVVVQAMLAAESSIEQAFGETLATVSGSFEVFKNQLREFVGEVDEITGGSRALAGALKLVGDNLALIASILLVIAGRAVFVFMANNAITAAGAIVKVITVVGTLISRLFLVKSALTGVAAVSALLATSSAPSGAVSGLLANNPLKVAANVSVATNATNLWGKATSAVSVAFAGLAATAGGVAAAIGIIVVVMGSLVSLFFSYLRIVDQSNKSLLQSSRAHETAGEKMVRLNKATKERIALLLEVSELEASGLGNDFGKSLLINSAAGGNLAELDKLAPGVNELLEDLKQMEALRAQFNDRGNLDSIAKSIALVRSQLEKSVSTTAADSVGSVLDQFDNIDKRIAGILKLIKKVKDFKFSEEELLGNEADREEALNKKLQDRLDIINLKGRTLDGEKTATAIRFLKEELDKLVGSVEATTASLAAGNAVFNQFGGDAEAIALSLAGATDKQVEAFLKEKQERERLVGAKRDAATAAEAAKRAQERETDAIMSASQALKEQIRLFGLVGRARQLAEFQALPGVNPDQVADFKKDQNTLEQKGIAADIQRQIEELKTNTIKFAEAARLGKELAARSGEDAAEDINKILIRGKDDLAKEAKKVAEAIAADLGTAGDKSIEEIRLALVAGAGVVGTQAGTALVTAFKAAVLGAIPGLKGLLPPGVPGGDQSTDAQNAARKERNAEIDNASRGAQEATKKLLDLNETARLFGPTMDASAKQGSKALQGFGEEAITFGGELKNAFSSIFGSLEDALVGFVTTGKLDFKSLINSIIADLARMVIRLLIIKPLMGFFGGFFGGIFGFSGGGSVGGAFGLPSFAGGGLISDNPAIPARFATGGRVHGPGTGVSDSVNALLSRDEFVVNAAASRPNMAGLEYLNSTGRMPGGGNVTSVAYAPNVSITVEGNSDRAAGNGAQIAKDFEQQMRAQFNEFVAQEQRPGGAFSKTNDDVL